MSLLIWTTVSVRLGRRCTSLLPHRYAALVSLLQTLCGMFGFASEKWNEIRCMKDCQVSFWMGTLMASERPGDTALNLRVAHGLAP